MGGRRKPTSLKLLDGAQPCRIAGEEPTSPAGLGECPGWLDPIGKATWARMMGLLGPMNLATNADREEITLYCVAYSTWHRALARVEEEGMTIETRTTIKAHPCLAIANVAQRQMARILSKFGMSPSDRAGLHVRERLEDDPFLSFLAGKNKAPDAKPKGRAKAR